MSKINAVRLINLNYNNNSIRISDETFYMNGESTLLSLRNGGGKSVLVQMMMAPFVHKRYRDAKERPFESYFTTDKPTFILVEWALDHGAGYVMAGMMVRRRQDISGDSNDDLEIIQFISEYQHACPHDLHHLPVIEKRRKEITLKSFLSCRQLFDSYKKDSSVTFFSYDMNNSAQSRQYFDKLMEYQINYKEWETIMKKVNLKESGLSDLFVDCKDEKGLVEKWLLDAVADKLNREKDRMREFQKIIEKYVYQYKDNKSKIKRRDIIRQFKEESSGIMESASGYQSAEEETKAQQERIGVFLWQLEAAVNSSAGKDAQLEADKEQLAEEIRHLEYQQISAAVYEAMKTERYHRANREMVQCERDAKELEYEQARHQLHLMDCARQQEELDEQTAECGRYAGQLDVLNQEERDFSKERKSLGYTLRRYYDAKCRQNREQEAEAKAQLEQLEAQAVSEEEKAEGYRSSVLEYSTSIGSMNARIQEYDAKEDSYNGRYEQGFIRNILGEYEPAQMELRRQEYEKELDRIKKTQAMIQEQAEEGVWKQKEKERNLEDTRQKKVQKEAELAGIKELCDQYAGQLKERRTILRYFGLDEDVLYDREKILNAAEHKIAEIEWAKRRLEKEEDELEKENQRLTQGRVMELPEEFEKLLEDMGVTYVYGMEWLKKNSYTESENQQLVREHPFLPYSLLLSRRDMDKLRRLKDNGTENESENKKMPLPYTSFPIPMMVREQLEEKSEGKEQPVLSLLAVDFYMLFNQHLLNEDHLKQMIAEKERQIAHKKEQIQIRRREHEAFFEKKEQLRSQTVTKELEQQAEQKREQTKEEIQSLAQAVVRQKEEVQHLTAQLRKLQQQIQDSIRQVSVKERRLEDLKELEKSYRAYLEHKEQLEALQHELAMTKEKERLAQETGERLRERARKQEIELDRLQRLSQELDVKAAIYQQYEKPEGDIAAKMVKRSGEGDKRQREGASGTDAAVDTEDATSPKKDAEDPARIEELEIRYQAITSQLSLRQQEIERLLQSAREKERRILKELRRRQKKYGLALGEWKQTVYSAKAEEYQEQLLTQKEQQYELKKAQWNEADKNAALASQRLEQQRKLLMEKCGTMEPLPKEEIQPVDFDVEMRRRDYKHKELEQAQQIVRKRTGWYEENLTALAEYAEFKPKDEIKLWKFMQRDMRAQIVADAGQKLNEIQSQTGIGQPELEQNQEKDQKSSLNGIFERLADADERRYALEMIARQQELMEKLSGEELRRKKGMLVRDYNQCMAHRQQQKERLTVLLNQMVRRDIFAEDFYRKPIESMLMLTDDAGQVLRQLQTTLMSYDSLMEKIQVDLSVIEDERDRIVELLGEYIHDVHQNLGRIDHNSTIQIRGKAVKMLKILLPDWEENAQMYQMRIQDFMEETTKKGIELLERNENAQEYFGTRVTTKNLYDVVAGIENVQIRLYKIEEQREYPITWSQVARNSGGEGFLSAFIILSSLLYYMRRDDTDLFAERNEGKVLVMDNPFAQTNASHLLKPLMDMAKKTNTQLICLSGLGGDSIYNRFDNIYVLNLVAAGLRSGMRYLKAEHMRGSEAETMQVSQIEVLGQQELIF